ncbi:hypothetical protein HKD37_09G025668 [Glycine soja]
MATPPSSPPSPTVAESQSPSTLKQTRKATQLRSLATRPVGAERPMVHVDPGIGKANSPHRKKLKTYLGIVAHDKAKFDIPEASDLRTKKKILQTVGERWRQFKYDLTSKYALAVNKESVTNTVCEKMCEKRHRSPRSKTLPLTCCLIGVYEYLENKFMDDKRKKKLEEVVQSESTDTVIDPPSPIRRHVKWKMARTKKTRQMTSEPAKEIADKIDSLEDQASQEHPSRVRATGADVTIKQYFGSALRTFPTSSSMAPEDLEQLTQQIRDQLEESFTENVT